MLINTFVFASLLALVQTAVALPKMDGRRVVRQVAPAPDAAGAPPTATAQPIPPPNSTPPSAQGVDPAFTPIGAAPAAATPVAAGAPAAAAPAPAGAAPVGTPAAGPTEIQDGQTGRLIVFPPRPTDTGLKRIPDDAHPYVAPGPTDHRGPCPALNTLANHGYIPRNGIATPEQILSAVMEAFNMDHDFGQFVVSFATLARGNAFTGQLSIGGVVDEIPPLPGKIDGPVAGGIAKHGRFEGDVSSTRQNVHIGDNVNFQNDLYDILLSYVGNLGEDAPAGKHSTVTIKAFQEFKYDAFNRDQAADKDLEFRIGRQLTTYSEVAFILDLFANGTDGKLSMGALGSIFRNQTFAPNWFRRAAPANLTVISGTAGLIMGAHPIPPGANVNGVYVPDQPAFTNFLCDAYADLAGNQLAFTLNQTTGILAQNVQTLTDAIYKPFYDTAGCRNRVYPHGPAGV